MIAAFTFAVGDASYHIRRDGREWLARCRGDFIDSSRDSFPLRGDVTFLNRFPVEITFLAVSGTEGSSYTLRYWAERDNEPAFLGMTSMLEQAQFAHLHEYLLANVGRRDLLGRLICKFHGFSEKHAEMETIPTRHEFLTGRYYFVGDDQSFVFATSLP